MEVSGQPHAPAVLSSGQKSQIPSGIEGSVGLRPVLSKVVENRKTHPQPGIELLFLGSPVHILISILTNRPLLHALTLMFFRGQDTEVEIERF
jgi:hypothetical protein